MYSIVTFLSLLTVSAVHSRHRNVIQESFNSLFDEPSSPAARSAAYVPLLPIQMVRSGTVNFPTLQRSSTGTTECSESGCVLDLHIDTILPAEAGSQLTFNLETDSPTEARDFVVTVPAFNVRYDLNYQYVQPKSSVFAYIGDSNTGDLDRCALACHENYQDSGSRSPNCSGIINPRKRSDTALLADLASRFRCGDWTPGALTLCQAKFVATSAEEGIVVSTVSESYTVNGRICAGIMGATLRCQDFTARDANLPLTLDIAPDISVDIRTLYDVDTTLVGAGILSHVVTGVTQLPPTGKIPVTDTYFASSVPSFGTYPSGGLGSLQSRYFDTWGNSSNNVFSGSTYSHLDVTWDLTSCRASSSFSAGRLVKVYTTSFTASELVLSSATGTFRRVNRKLFARARAQRPSRACLTTVLVTLIVSAVVAGAATASVAIAAGTQSCCSQVSGLSEDYLTNILQSFQPIGHRLAALGPEVDGFLSLDRGQPIGGSLSLTKTTGAKFDVTVRARGIHLEFVSGHVKSWSFDELYYFTSSGGSRITITVDVDGTGSNVNLVSENLLLATSTFFAPYGRFTRTIAISVLDPTAPMTLCLGGFDDCKTPDSSTVDTGPDGGEGNGENGGQTGTHAHSRLVWSNWQFATVYMLWWIFIAVTFLIVLIAMLRGCLRMTGKLFLLVFCCQSTTTNAQGYNTAQIHAIVNHELPTVVADQASLVRPLDCHLITYAGSSFSFRYPTFERDGQLELLESPISVTYRVPNSDSCATYPATFATFAFDLSTNHVVLANQNVGYLPNTCAATFSVTQITNVTDVSQLTSHPAFTALDLSIYTPFTVVYQVFTTVGLAWAFDTASFAFGGISSPLRTRSVVWCERPFSPDDIDELIELGDPVQYNVLTTDRRKVVIVVVPFVFNTAAESDTILELVKNEFGYRALDNRHVIYPRAYSTSYSFGQDVFVFNCIDCGSIESYEPPSTFTYLSPSSLPILLQPAVNHDEFAFSPICHSTRTITYCPVDNGLVLSNQVGVKEILFREVAIGEYRFSVERYSQELFFQIDTNCQGTLAYDTTGTIVCTDDCCVYSVDSMHSLKQISAAQHISTPSTIKRNIFVFNSTTSFISPLAETEACSTASFVLAWQCYLKSYAAVFWSMVGLSAFMVLLLIMWGLYRLICRCLRNRRASKSKVFMKARKTK